MRFAHGKSTESKVNPKRGEYELGEILNATFTFWNTPIGRIVSSLALAALTYLILWLVAPWATRRTKYRIDDIIVGIVRLPLLIIVLLWGLAGSLSLTDFPREYIDVAIRLYRVFLILAVTYMVMKLFSGVVARYAEHYARESESNLDDVLVPLLTRRIVPLVTVLISVITILWVIGVDLGAVLISLGALSFLLVFLFQEPLSNLFSGVYLVMDVPFKYGDLIILEDEKTYRVEEIGSRVTKLYNTDDHTIGYIPNNKLAGQRLINLTRPNVELRMKIPMGVGYGTKNLYRVQDILTEAANTHPHVLGNLDVKLSAMTRKLNNISNENSKITLLMEMERLRVENDIRNRCDDLIRRLQFLAQFVSALENRGLDPKERKRIAEEEDIIWPMVNDICRKLTIWIHLIGCLDAYYKCDEHIPSLSSSDLDKKLPEINQIEKWRKEAIKPEDIRKQLLDNGYIAVIGTFRDVDEEFFLAGGNTWTAFSRELYSNGVEANIYVSLDAWKNEHPAWSTFKDFYVFYEGWHKNVCDLLEGLKAWGKAEQLRGEQEFQLDVRINKVISLLEQKFLLRTPGWQKPDADFVGFGASSLDFRLEFFVDDLVRRHFELLDDVLSDIGLEIFERLNEAGIEVPFPQIDVWFKDQWMKDVLQKYGREQQQ